MQATIVEAPTALASTMHDSPPPPAQRAPNHVNWTTPTVPAMSQRMASRHCCRLLLILGQRGLKPLALPRHRPEPAAGLGRAVFRGSSSPRTTWASPVSRWTAETTASSPVSQDVTLQPKPSRTRRMGPMGESVRAQSSGDAGPRAPSSSTRARRGGLAPGERGAAWHSHWHRGAAAFPLDCGRDA